MEYFEIAVIFVERQVELSLSPSVRVEGILPDEFEVTLMLYPIFEYAFVADGRLLLVDPSGVLLVHPEIRSYLTFNSSCFLSWDISALSKDLTNVLDLGNYILGRSLMMDAILNEGEGTY